MRNNRDKIKFSLAATQKKQAGGDECRLFSVN